MKWIRRGILSIVALYVVLFATVMVAMMRPPEQFGAVVKHLPPALVWGALPAPRMWLWARGGTLEEGGLAPDFSLPTHDKKGSVTLSSFRGRKPVVLVFGSYT